MTWMTVLLIALIVALVVSDYHRRAHLERERVWRKIARDAIADMAVMRRQLNGRSRV